MPPKTNIVTNALGRTARPKAETAHVWPWKHKHTATSEEKLDPKNAQPGPPGSCLYGDLVQGLFRKSLLAERAKVIALRGVADGVMVTLENPDGETGECYLAHIALVPKGSIGRRYTAPEVFTILRGIEAAHGFFEGGAGVGMRDLVAIKEHDGGTMLLDRSFRAGVVARLIAGRDERRIPPTSEDDRLAINAAIELLQAGGERVR